MRKRFDNSTIIDDWYEVKELRDNLYLVDEQDHVAFFVIKDNRKGYFFDSGLGLVESSAYKLLEFLGIDKFDVIATHSHCDHSGLNYLAENVQILKDEWEKYCRFDEHSQIKTYCEMIGDDLPWPDKLEQLPLKQEKWNPTSFISDGDLISIGNWNLKSAFLPGHTCGHLIFQEKEKEVFFLGDFAVTGTNFIHLKDSSILGYYESLQKLISLLHGTSENVLLLSCHDEIPLPKSYLFELVQTMDDIRSGKLQSLSKWEENEVFSEAWLYDTGKVRITIRTDQIDSLKNLK